MSRRKKNKKKARKRSQSRPPEEKGRSKSDHVATPAPRGEDIKLVVAAARSVIQLGIWITGILVVLKFVADAPGYAVVASVLAAAIAAYDLFDVVNWRRPKYAFEPNLRPLVGAYACSLLAMLGLVAAGIFTRGRWWEALLIVVGFIAIAFARGRIEKKTCRRLAELHIEEGDPLWFKGLHERLEYVVELWVDWKPDHSPRVLQILVRELACRLRAGLRGPMRSARRFVAVVAMLFSVVLGAWAGLATGERAIKAVEGTPHSAGAAIPPERKRRLAHAEAPQHQSTSSEATPSAAPLSECAVSPGTGAPGWARQAIHRLYLGGPGVSEPPGTLIAGCPGRYLTKRTKDGPVVYTIGEDPTGLRALSIAVDSSRAPALFLAPAIQPVLGLIHRLGAVGGVRRFNVGTGQFYPVQTDRGTYLLIRQETGTEQMATPFEVIPPAVTQAWAAAITRSGHFLWPSLSMYGDNRTYDFDTGSSERLYSFAYRPSSEPEPELSPGELTDLAEAPE